MTKQDMLKWKKAKAKDVEAEFERLLQFIGDTNGTRDLIDVVVGIPTIKQKRDFVEGYHEQDED